LNQHKNLIDPNEKSPPSNKKALIKMVEAGQKHGFSVEYITKKDYGRLNEFDALFIRETTSVNHHTYRFATRAFSEGLVVIDDPESILKCTNKVFLAELLKVAKVSTPKTIIVHKQNRKEVIEELGLPLVLKMPDSHFSYGVLKVSTKEEFKEKISLMFKSSELVIAQEYLYSNFDWRVGILDKKPIFSCKYHMAKGHWQIYNWSSKNGKYSSGDHESFPLDLAPKEVIDTALKAANLIGDGLYGVDLKEVDGKVVVIEINDNPNIDEGIEDEILKEGLYEVIACYFRTKIEKKLGLKPHTEQSEEDNNEKGKI
jgi:glutathione synthase/RimK-type ligase-like ATP-grasp enzyme